MSDSAYYNDNDPQICAWLGELIKAGLITNGEVDERPIQEVSGKDLSRFSRVHLFAGIGGWDYALQLAGWTGPVWSGSCPCQPFSCAGQRKGISDKRHLWPEMRRLIEQCRPPAVCGEQVASKDGRLWFAGVRADLEALGYAVWGADLCAAGVGAPNIRQRLFWMAYARHQRWEGLLHRPGSGLTENQGASCAKSGRSGGLGGVVQSDGPGSQPREQACASLGYRGSALTAGSLGFWSDYDLIPCADGKTRRVRSGTFPLVNGAPARVVRLRGYGNAINPQVAAEFIQASVEAISEITC